MREEGVVIDCGVTTFHLFQKSCHLTHFGSRAKFFLELEILSESKLRVRYSFEGSTIEETVPTQRTF